MMGMKGMMGMMKGGGKGKGFGKQSQFHQTMGKIMKTDPEKRVYIGGLPEGTKWKELLKHFEDSGHKPSLIEAFYNKTGVAVFDDAEAAAAAISALNGSEFNGHSL